MDFLTPFINWLLTCPQIASNKLFLNNINAKDNNIQVVTQQIMRSQSNFYVDGSIEHTVIFTVFDYKSPSFNQLVTTAINKNENVEDLLNTSAIIDWIEQQRKLRNFPLFTGKFECIDVYSQYLSPSTPTTDNSGNAPLSRYSIPIVCEVFENV